MASREHKYQFPLKRLESLIQLATDFNLSLLEVGDVKIVPGGAPRRQSIPATDDSKLRFLEEAERKVGRELTPEEIQDELLFGPGGSIPKGD